MDRQGKLTAFFRDIPQSEVGTRSQQLAIASVSYLDDAALSTRFALLSEALSMADVSVCAGVGSGTLTGEQYASLVGSLPAAKIEQWAELSITAMRTAITDPVLAARIKAGVPDLPHPTHHRDIEAAMAILETRLPESVRARFHATRKTRLLTDAEECWLQKIIYSTAATLADQDGPRIRAALAAAEATSSHTVPAAK